MRTRQANTWLWAACGAVVLMAFEAFNSVSLPGGSTTPGGLLGQGIGGFILGAFAAGIRNWIGGRRPT